MTSTSKSRLTAEQRAEYERKFEEVVSDRRKDPLLDYDLLADRPWREKLQKIGEAVRLAVLIVLAVIVGGAIDVYIFGVVDTRRYMVALPLALIIYVIYKIWKIRSTRADSSDTTKRI